MNGESTRCIARSAEVGGVRGVPAKMLLHNPGGGWSESRPRWLSGRMKTKRDLGGKEKRK